MDPDDIHSTAFLEELHRQTQGDTAAKVSMYEVGAALGLNRSEAGNVAESLIVDGLAELKTLAGGIGITTAGLKLLGHEGKAEAAAPTATQSFSKGPAATPEDRQIMEGLIRLVKEGFAGQSLAYETLEQIVFDLKTAELHLLSPKPKVPVLRELCRSLHNTLADAGLKETAAKFAGLLG